jgi:hypothetical protein
MILINGDTTTPNSRYARINDPGVISTEPISVSGSCFVNLSPGDTAGVSVYQSTTGPLLYNTETSAKFQITRIS